MPHYICSTCGTQYAESADPPRHCAICEDERQYVRPAGQQWTTLAQLRLSHRNSIRNEETNLIGIGVEPQFGIGQRALLVRTPCGNVLWDCLALLDPALIDAIKGLGGITAIAISHPHYYTSMVEWARAFDAPCYLHAADKQWVMRPDRAIEFWEGDSRNIAEGMTLIRCGGHFAGGVVLHWRDGAGGNGALLTGDILQVVADRKHVSFMYSYPNFIPLSITAVDRIEQAVANYRYDRIYGAFWDAVISQDAATVVARSAQRYRNAIR